MNNKKIGFIVVGIIVLVGTFYGGIVYGKSQIPIRSQGGQGNQALGQNNRGSANGIRNGGAFGGMTSGEIISMDTQSVTIKLKDGSSKIVFYSNKTPIEKNVSGTSADMVIGKQISITGAANSDGSITAENIQLRPQIIAPVVTPKP